MDSKETKLRSRMEGILILGFVLIRTQVLSVSFNSNKIYSHNDIFN